MHVHVHAVLDLVGLQCKKTVEGGIGVGWIEQPDVLACHQCTDGEGGDVDDIGRLVADDRNFDVVKVYLHIVSFEHLQDV